MRTHGRERFGTTRILVRGRPRPHIAMTARIAASNGLSRPRSRPGRLINAVADYSRLPAVGEGWPGLRRHPDRPGSVHLGHMVPGDPWPWDQVLQIGPDRWRDAAPWLGATVWVS